MGPYRPLAELAPKHTTPSQSEIGWSGGLGIIATLCGEVRVSVLVISVFVPWLSELWMYVRMVYDRGMGPCRPQTTVALCTSPGK